ncbi:MAG: sulfotransferase [Myxococcales bacterium]|nr:sulfotransferase [Myxococcales bacterium]
MSGQPPALIEAAPPPATTAHGARPTWFPRAYNRTVRALGPLGSGLGDLDWQNLRSVVERRVGRPFVPGGDWDFAEAAFQNALSLYRDTVELTPFGRLILRQTVLRNLTSALRLAVARERFPAIFERRFAPPIIIVGLHRSGTTYLHRLLARHPQLRAPRTWELYDPVPHLPRSRWRDGARRRGVQVQLGFGRLAVPDLDTVHHIRVDSFEESAFLLEPSGMLFSSIFAFGAHAHADWLMTQDASPAYHRMHDLLALMAPPEAAGDQRRWLLKCPMTTWHLPAMLRVFPDASVIHLRRPLHASLASVCSFAAVLQRGSRPHVDFHRLGADMTEMYLRGHARAARARRAHPRAHWTDVQYAHLVARPQETVDRLLPWLGLTERLEVPEATDRVAKARGAGDHIYRAAEFGIDRAVLDARLAEVDQRIAQEPA